MIRYNDIHVHVQNSSRAFNFEFLYSFTLDILNGITANDGNSKHRA